MSEQKSTPEIWYESGRYGAEITRLEVTRSTDKSLWIKEKDLWSGRDSVRRALITEYHHKTFESAKSFLLDRLKQRRARLMVQLERATADLKTAELLSPELFGEGE